MPDIVGEAVDRLITIEAKNPACRTAYCCRCTTRRARRRAASRSRMAAAKGLKELCARASVVFIMTGAGYEPTMPKGESDGPPGAASLARILYRGLGASPGLRQRGMPRRADRRLERGGRPDGKAVRAGARPPPRRGHRERADRPVQGVSLGRRDLRQDDKPKAVVSAERLGAGADGNVHTRDRPAADRARSRSSRAASTSARSWSRPTSAKSSGRHRRPRKRAGLRHDLRHGRQDDAEGQDAGHGGEDRRGGSRR